MIDLGKIIPDDVVQMMQERDDFLHELAVGYAWKETEVDRCILLAEREVLLALLQMVTTNTHHQNLENGFWLIHQVLQRAGKE